MYTAMNTDMTVAQLKGLCKTYGIKGYSKMKKAKLIELLADYHEKQQSKTEPPAQELSNHTSLDNLVGKHVQGGRFKGTYYISSILPSAGGSGEEYVCFEIINGQRVRNRTIFGVKQLNKWIKSDYFRVVEPPSVDLQNANEVWENESFATHNNIVYNTTNTCKKTTDMMGVFSHVWLREGEWWTVLAPACKLHTLTKTYHQAQLDKAVDVKTTATTKPTATPVKHQNNSSLKLTDAQLKQQAALRNANHQSMYGNMSPRHQQMTRANLMANSKARPVQKDNKVQRYINTYTSQLGTTERQAIRNGIQIVNNIRSFASGFMEGRSYLEQHAVERPKFDRTALEVYGYHNK